MKGLKKTGDDIIITESVKKYKIVQIQNLMPDASGDTHNTA